MKRILTSFFFALLLSIAFAPKAYAQPFPSGAQNPLNLVVWDAIADDDRKAEPQKKKCSDCHVRLPKQQIASCDSVKRIKLQEKANGFADIFMFFSICVIACFAIKWFPR